VDLPGEGRDEIMPSTGQEALRTSSANATEPFDGHYHLSQEHEHIPN
jgi:hypothetical protein